MPTFLTEHLTTLPQWLAAGAVLVTSVLFFLAMYNAVRLAKRPTREQLSSMLRCELDRLQQLDENRSRGLREELSGGMRGIQDSTLKIFRELADTLQSSLAEFGRRTEAGLKVMDERSIAIGKKLDEGIAALGQASSRDRDELRQLVESKLDNAARTNAATAVESRQEVIASFQALGETVTGTLTQLGSQQKERLENITGALDKLTGQQERAQEALKQSVEQRLDAVRQENAAKLDQMRDTVDQKLQTTLETRLGESFNRVVEQLERVHKGIGEMQSLATGVGDLKRVLTNVRVRGTFGEVQLGALLEQFLSAEQFIKNVRVKEETQERVEFAIKLPGRDGNGEVLLPVDAKFPQEDFDRLLSAGESGDANALADASRALENRVRACAKTISEKYIAPPKTTEFAILFLPTEGLYAEVLRRPGLFESIQRDYHVTLAGPTTFTALLNALQMGFRSLVIEKHSSEVWKILGAVRSEFSKYNEVVERLGRQLHTAANSVETLGTRTRAMDRKLRDVECIPDNVPAERPLEALSVVDQT